MRNRHLILLSFFFALTGILLFCYKAYILDFPLVPDKTTQVWIVEARLNFRAKNKPVKANLYIPKSDRQFLILDENLISRGFGLTTKSKDNNRQANWSIRKFIGNASLYYRAVVRRTGMMELSHPKIEISAETPLEGAKLEAMESLIGDIQAESADTESFASNLLKRLNQSEAPDNVSLLLGKKSTNLNKALLAKDVLQRVGIASQITHGVFLKDQVREAQITERLEVFEAGIWYSFDPLTGELVAPDDFLPWWIGADQIAEVTNADRVNASISIESYYEDAVSSAITEGSIRSPAMLKFSIFSLPVETQSVYKVLLLIPLGAFIVVILRNLIGIKTFGTFMPVLIALAFRETQLLWGLALFIIIVGVGLAVRFYLEHLKLLLVPRLASVLTLVVLFMLVISVVTHKLGLERGISVALFPMVILTMSIERMSIVWDELGPLAALKQSIGSLFVASLIYAAMSIPLLAHILFVFPELSLVILALILLLGRYTGYRLLELPRFKAILVNRNEPL